MNCKEKIDSLYAYADGVLDRETERRVIEHLDLCPPCRGIIDEQRGLREALRRGFDAVPLPRGLEDRVRRSIAAGQPVGHAARRTWLLRLTALAATLLLAATITWHFVFRVDPAVAAITAKHRYCCGRGDDHHHADLPKSLAGLAAAITSHENNKLLKIAAIAPDLRPYGFEFESAGFCGLRDLNCTKGAHIVYAKVDGKHAARFSIFSVPQAQELTHLETPSGAIQPITVPESKAGPALCLCVWCRKSTHYVCCGEVSPPQLVEMTSAVQNALANPQTEAMFAMLSRSP